MLAKRVKYGDDADGNRGIYIYEHELEESDYGDVVDAIKEYWCDEDYEDEMQITLYCEESDRYVEFDVKISDYLTWVEYEKMVRGEL